MIFPRFDKDPKGFKHWMDELVDRYNRAEFIVSDPISVPHRYTDHRDQEIAGFLAAVLAWGNRTTIINKCTELMERMDNKPYDFIVAHAPTDLKHLEGFVHRTFNDTDLLYFVHRLKRFYAEEGGLEAAFFHHDNQESGSVVQDGLVNFRNRFFDDPLAPRRSGKHIASPASGSACKRLNMFLRWVVRKDGQGVDLGIWHGASSHDLFCPLDVHVAKTARHLGLLTRRQDDWKACAELTGNLRTLDPTDPVRYDYALFGAGINKLLI